MNKLTCTLLVSLGALQFAVAADTTATPPKPDGNTPTASDVAADAAPPKIELKKKSEFVVEGNSRNPFWPIGWKPAPKLTTPAGTTEQAGPEISPTAFLVSSIATGDGLRFAIINGKPMQEGQVFGLQIGTQVYQITVKAIEDGQVILQRRGRDFAVPLRRK
ncbi:MAG: hypothetical protein ABR526_12120 [Chthoniobacterales bacterium]